MKRKNYLLLELLICFALVSLCLIPLVKKPFTLVKESFQIREKMEWMRVSDLLFAETLEALISHKIPLEALPTQDSKPLQLSPLNLTPSFGGTLQAQRKIKCAHRDQERKEVSYRQLSLEIYFVPLYHPKKDKKISTFTHKFIIEIDAPEKAEENLPSIKDL